MRPLLYQSDKVRIWERFGKPPLVEELLPHPVGGPAHATWQPADLACPALAMLDRLFPGYLPELRERDAYLWRIYVPGYTRSSTLLLAEGWPTCREAWYGESLDESNVPIRVPCEPRPAELVAHVARGSRPLAHAQTLADIWRVINQFPDQALEEARCLPR